MFRVAQRALISQDRSRESYPPREDGDRTASQRIPYGGGRRHRGTERKGSAAAERHGDSPGHRGAHHCWSAVSWRHWGKIRRAVGSLKTLPKAVVWRRGWTQEGGLGSGGRTEHRGEDWTQEGGLDSGGRIGLRRED